MTEATTALPPPASGDAPPLVNPRAQSPGGDSAPLVNPGTQSLDQSAREVESANAQSLGQNTWETEGANAHHLDQSARETRNAGAHHPDQGARSIEGIPDEEMLYDLADLFKVFSDTTRIKILYVLMERDQCVADIAEAIGATQSAVSHQLRILKQAHLVRFQRHGKSIRYSLADDHVYTVLAQGMSHICE